MLCRCEDQLPDAGRVVADESQAGDHVTGSEDRQAGERCRDHHRQLEADQRRRGLEPTGVITAAMPS